MARKIDALKDVPFTSDRFATILHSILREKDTEDNEDILSSWTEETFEVVLQNNLDLSRLFPFFGRESEVAELAKLLVDFKMWWELDTDERKKSDAHKLENFSFFVIGAASGIGKTTFAMRAFQHIADCKPDSITDSEHQDLRKFLDPCVQKQTLFRITYVEGLLDWEMRFAAKSIALKLLYQFCKRRTALSYSNFADCFFGIALSLADVISYISQETGSKMVIIHIDETNHLADAGYATYLVHVMFELYSVMASTSCFVPCLFTGTNAHFLINLQEISSFRVKSIKLPPLGLGVMVNILVHVASKIENKNYLPRDIQTILKQLIAEEGGNPQILRFQMFKMGELGKGQSSARNTVNMNYPGFSKFMASQSTDLVKALRENLQQTLIRSHILSSVAILQDPPLRRLLLGYALSGDTVSRGTPLKGDWNIGRAELAGYIYLNPVKADIGTKRPADTEFCVILPLLFYEYFVPAVAPGDLLNIDRWHEMNSREVEKLDLAALAFAFEWYFEKRESVPNSDKLTQFKLGDVFPRIKDLPDISLNKPKKFHKVSIRFTEEKESFTQVASAFTEVATFTQGRGNDSFPDAWGHFQKVNGDPFTIFIQSKKTITGGNFTQKDLTQQLEYLQEMTHDWILFIITDGNIDMNVPAEYSRQVFAFDHSTQHLFYGPVLAFIREALIQLEAERE